MAAVKKTLSFICYLTVLALCATAAVIIDVL